MKKVMLTLALVGILTAVFLTGCQGLGNAGALKEELETMVTKLTTTEADLAMLKTKMDLLETEMNKLKTNHPEFFAEAAAVTTQPTVTTETKTTTTKTTTKPTSKPSKKVKKTK